MGGAAMSFLDRDAEQSGNWVLDHWRGALSLPVSYWINGSLIAGVVAGLGQFLLEDAVADSASVRLSSFLIVLAWLLSLAIWFWAVVGIWRSANNHESRGGNGIWAKIAKGMVVLGAIRIGFATVTLAPAHIETARLAAGFDPMGPPAEVRIDQDVLLIDGVISLGSARAVEQALSSSRNVRKVSISSQGGRLGEAKQIAEMISNSKMDVVARQNCHSACTIVLLAGEERSIEGGTSVGFHQASYPGLPSSQTSVMNDQLTSALRAKKVDEGFIVRAMEPNPNELWTPTEDEMFDAGVLNSVGSGRVEKDLENFMTEINRKLPINVDELTILKGVELNKLNLRYNYAVNVLASQIATRSAKTQVERSTFGAVCAQGRMRRLVDAGAIFSYSYNDRNGVNLFSFSIKSCGKA